MLHLCWGVGKAALPIHSKRFRWLFLDFNGPKWEDGKGSGIGFLPTARVLPVATAFLETVALKQCVDSMLEQVPQGRANAVYSCWMALTKCKKTIILFSQHGLKLLVFSGAVCWIQSTGFLYYADVLFLYRVLCESSVSTLTTFVVSLWAKKLACWFLYMCSELLMSYRYSSVPLASSLMLLTV